MQINPVWKQVTPELREELLALWGESKAIGNPELAKARTDQAVCIGRDADGKLVAVATSTIRVLPRLRQPMYYYRQFFSPSVRGQRQTKAFAIRAKEILQAHNAGLERPESLGILIELQNKQLDAAYTVAYESEADYTFIGYSPRGNKLYVSYFKDARLGPPVQLQRTAATAGRRGA